MDETPFEDRSVPRVEIEWDRSFWWWYPLTRAIHPAIRMTSLLFSLAAILLIQLGLWLAENWFPPNFELGAIYEWTRSDIFGWPRPTLIANFPEISLNLVAYFSFLVVWLAILFALFGGVLARRAAIELGQRTVGSWFRSVSLVCQRIVSYLWAAVMHLVALAALALPVLALGWLARWGSVAATIAGILLLLSVVPLLFAAGRTFLSLLIAFPLSVCAISVEKRADAFEGFSRSNAYLFQRPVVTAICIITLLAAGEVGAFLVHWVVHLGWGLLGELFSSSSGRSEVASSYVQAGDWLASNLIVAFRFSYFWSATAALYLILRKSVDDVELEELEMLDTELERNPPQIPNTSQPADAPSSNAETRTSDADSARGIAAEGESTSPDTAQPGDPSNSNS